MDLIIDFFVNKGADLSKDDVDEALKKLNKLFEPAGIKFSAGSLTPLKDSKFPEYPKESGKDTATADQKGVAKEAEDAAKALAKAGHIVVKVVHNFQAAGKKPGDPATINGITINNTVVIADPSEIKKNTLGQEEFWHALAHELGHSLGLTHKVMESDKDYKHQQGGEYNQPNLMAPDSDTRNGCNELTHDQIEQLKKAAAALAAKDKKDDQKK